MKHARRIVACGQVYTILRQTHHLASAAPRPYPIPRARCLIFLLAHRIDRKTRRSPDYIPGRSGHPPRPRDSRQTRRQHSRRSLASNEHVNDHFSATVAERCASKKLPSFQHGSYQRWWLAYCLVIPDLSPIPAKAVDGCIKLIVLEKLTFYR